MSQKKYVVAPGRTIPGWPKTGRPINESRLHQNYVRAGDLIEAPAKSNPKKEPDANGK